MIPFPTFAPAHDGRGVCFFLVHLFTSRSRTLP
jgi:hypothetical protein